MIAAAAPWNMLAAMGIAGFLCIYLAWPWGGYQTLYALMPYDLDHAYKPYTWDHVVFQMQLLFAAIFAFTLLKRFKLYPAERRAEILDADWTYRSGLAAVMTAGLLFIVLMLAYFAR